VAKVSYHHLEELCLRSTYGEKGRIKRRKKFKRSKKTDTKIFLVGILSLHSMSAQWCPDYYLDISLIQMINENYN